MTREKITKNRKYYLCEECNFAYEKNEIAKKCEDWCRIHHSCNLEITKHAINLHRGSNL